MDSYNLAYEMSLQNKYVEAEKFIPELSQRDQHLRAQLFFTENHLDYKPPLVIYSF